MLLTQLFYIGSSIPHIHMLPLLVLLRPMYVLRSIWLFLGFSSLQMTLSAPASSSFVSEVQRKIGTLTLSYNPHCVKCYTNTQLETGVVSKGCQQKRDRKRGERNRYLWCFCPFLDPEVLQPHKSTSSRRRHRPPPMAGELTLYFPGDSTPGNLPPACWLGHSKDLAPKETILCNGWSCSTDFRSIVWALCRLRQASSHFQGIPHNFWG